MKRMSSPGWRITALSDTLWTRADVEEGCGASAVRDPGSMFCRGEDVSLDTAMEKLVVLLTGTTAVLDVRRRGGG